jgi:hypothetical protein
MSDQISAATRLLLDRRQIRDCVHRYSRGLDRHDDELLASAFHPDAIDNHGNWVGRLPEFVQWANHEVHDPYILHNHHVTTHTAEIDGDVAHAETYVIFILRHSDGKTVRVGFGRYADRFERRNGEWRIVVRQIATDLRLTADGSLFDTDDGYYHGTWDRSDISYDEACGVPDDLAARLAGEGA